MTADNWVGVARQTSCLTHSRVGQFRPTAGSRCVRVVKRPCPRGITPAVSLPAAMAAGVVRNLRSFEDIFDRVMGGEYAVAAWTGRGFCGQLTADGST